MTPKAPVLQHYDAGGIALYGGSAPPSPSRPLAVMLHGAFRQASTLGRWPGQLSDVADVLLFDLPGHGRSQATTPATVTKMAEALLEPYRRIVSRRPAVLLVGESVGALVALALHRLAPPASPTGLLLADPPFSTAKLWRVQNELRYALAERRGDINAAALVRDTFGMSDAGLDEIIYYDLLRDVTEPTLIVRGDVPLFPPRLNAGMTTLFDDVDRFVVERFYGPNIQIRQVRGCGHLLLTEAEETCRQIMREMLDVLEHGGCEPAGRAP